MNFQASLGQRTPPQETDLFVVNCGSRMLYSPTSDGIRFVRLDELGDLRPSLEDIIELGLCNDTRCFALALPEDALLHCELPSGIQAAEARSLLVHLLPGQFQAVALARHLLWWKNAFRFCGRCGAPFSDHPHERARLCETCGNILYPVIAPAIIVAIHKDDSILLARNGNFPGNRHSVIAGFVEPGESLEQAVAREVREEVGLEVDEIQYLESQPWSFPNSLMLGFSARWKQGAICPDGHEIVHAAWFRKGDTLPELPPQGSISRRLIDTVLA